MRVSRKIGALALSAVLAAGASPAYAATEDAAAGSDPQQGQLAETVPTDDQAEEALNQADGLQSEPAPEASTAEISTVADGEATLTSSDSSADSSSDQAPASIDDYALANKGTLESGMSYVIAAGNAHRKVLDVSGGSKSNYANVQIFASNMTNA